MDELVWAECASCEGEEGWFEDCGFECEYESKWVLCDACEGEGGQWITLKRVESERGTDRADNRGQPGPDRE